MKANVLAIGGVEGHVHVLVRLPASLSVSSLVNQIKGSSSHLINHTMLNEEQFKWQGGYGAFSVSPSDMERIRQYIANQREHHRLGTTDLEMEHEGD